MRRHCTSTHNKWNSVTLRFASVIFFAAFVHVRFSVALCEPLACKLRSRSTAQIIPNTTLRPAQPNRMQYYCLCGRRTRHNDRAERHRFSELIFARLHRNVAISGLARFGERQRTYVARRLTFTRICTSRTRAANGATRMRKHDARCTQCTRRSRCACYNCMAL